MASASRCARLSKKEALWREQPSSIEQGIPIGISASELYKRSGGALRHRTVHVRWPERSGEVGAGFTSPSRVLSVVTVRYRASPCIPAPDVNLTVSTGHLVRLDCEQESGLKPPGHIGPGLQVSRKTFLLYCRQSLPPVLALALGHVVPPPPPAP